MQFTIVAVGKLKERFWVDACAEYLKRLQPYAKTAVVEIADVDPAKAGGDAAAVEREGAAILKTLPDRAHVIVLAIDGKQRSSESLSARIDDLALAGTSEIAFVIGGSCGTSPAGMCLSFCLPLPPRLWNLYCGFVLWRLPSLVV